MKSIKKIFTFLLLCICMVSARNNVRALGGPRVAVPSPPTSEEEAEKMKIPLTEEERMKAAEELGLKELVKEPSKGGVILKEHYLTSIENHTTKPVTLSLILRKKLAKEKGYTMGTIKSIRHII